MVSSSSTDCFVGAAATKHSPGQPSARADMLFDPMSAAPHDVARQLRRQNRPNSIPFFFDGTATTTIL